MTNNQTEGEEAVLDKIAEMPEPHREMGNRLHTLIMESAPQLTPRTWYGMPAYENSGKTVCFFTLGEQYISFGLTEDAYLTVKEGAPHQLIESAWYIAELDEATEVKLSEIVSNAVD